MADLDHFKRINDTHGHPVGDVVLREVARRMSSILRPYDSIGWYGGEEFLVVLPGRKLSSTLEVAERVRRAVAGAPVATPSGMIPISASFGAVTVEGASFDADALIRMAEETLYRAKRRGRNRVEVTINLETYAPVDS